MIKVSHEDISSTEILSYPQAERFIKLPIENYLHLLEIEPIGPQIALINAINNPNYRFVTACLSRRTGKTFISNVIAQLVTLVPNSNVLIMSPNYSLSNISFELQRQLIKKFDIEVLKDNAKDKVITLTNGSSIRIGSVTQADSVVGRSYDLILYDEAALAAGMDSFNIQLRPTLDTTNSKAIFISTPRGKGNWFKELYDRGGSNEYPQWASIHSDYRENPRVKEDDIKEAKNSMSRSEFAQEYLADFTTFSGQIWQLDENCIQDLSGVDFSKLDIIAGLDLGFKDETALCVIAHDYEEGKFYFIDEYEESGQTTKYHAEQIQRLEDKYGLDYIYIDSAAAQTRYDFAINYDISTINAKKSVLDGIGFVSAMVETGRITIDKDCLNVIDTFDNYRWDPRENLLKERPLHDHYSHMADAIRYALYTHSGHMEILE
jgi:hypothetical protein